MTTTTLFTNVNVFDGKSEKLIEKANVLVGIDHVGFGSDWIPDVTLTAIGVQSPLGQMFFPDGGISMEMGRKGVPTANPAQIVAALVDKLLEHGYTESDCKKFLGGNFYRVFKQVWK